MGLSILVTPGGKTRPLATLKPGDSPVAKGLSLTRTGAGATQVVNPNDLVFKYNVGDNLANLGAVFTRATTATYVDANGVVQTAAINAARDAHYINGARTLLLEGARTNRILHSNNQGNAAWLKRGTAAVTASPAASPTGAMDAWRVAGIGAGSVDDLAIGATGFTASAAIATSGWFRRVSTSGNVRVLSAEGAPYGHWWVNLSLLPDAWVRLTDKHPAVTVQVPFAASAAGNAGLHFVREGSSGTYSFDLWNWQQEEGAFPSSDIVTTTAALQRAADNLYFPLTTLPQEMTFYTRFVEQGTYLSAADTRVVSFGSGAAPHVRQHQWGGFYLSRINVGGSGDNSSLSVASSQVLADVVELRTTLFPDGLLMTSFAKNAGAEQLGIKSTIRFNLPTAWSEARLWVNSAAASAYGFNAFQSIKVALGPERTLVQMRSL